MRRSWYLHRFAVALMATLLLVGATPGGASGPDAASDPEAVALAERIVAAHGGREAWEAARSISWISNGQRLHVWDKETGDLRVENRITIVVTNLDTGGGRAWRYGEELTDPAAVARAIEFGYEAFRMDANEFLLPFLLDRPDFVLHAHPATELDDEPLEVLGITFTGDEPYAGAEYRLLVDPLTHRIRRWEYYMDAGDQRPRFAVPWRGYEWNGGLLLSLDRGEKRHTHVRVAATVPATVFESPAPVPWLEPALEAQDEDGSASDPV